MKSLLCVRKVYYVRKSLLCVRSSEHRRHPLISTFMAQTGIRSELNKRRNLHSCCLYDVAYCEPGGAKFAHWEYYVLVCDLGECFSSRAWYLLCKTWAPYLPQENYSTHSDGILFGMGGLSVQPSFLGLLQEEFSINTFKIQASLSQKSSSGKQSH